MNAISVRRIEPDLHAWLRDQAASHGVSMEEEVRAILRAAREAAEEGRRATERARWEAIFARAITPPPGTPDSTEIVRRMRDER